MFHSFACTAYTHTARLSCIYTLLRECGLEEDFILLQRCIQYAENEALAKREAPLFLLLLKIRKVYIYIVYIRERERERTIGDSRSQISRPYLECPTASQSCPPPSPPTPHGPCALFIRAASLAPVAIDARAVSTRFLVKTRVAAPLYSLHLTKY